MIFEWSSLRALWLVLLLMLSIGPAAAEQVRFDRLGAEDGLSQLSGNAIAQDRFGFLWIATQDGLNRYDGYELKVFKGDSSDTDSLWDNFITGLWLDSSDHLWVVPNAAGAINRYRLEEERFERFTLQTAAVGAPAAAPINPRALFEDGRGRLWIGTFGSGLFVLDLESGLAKHLYADANDPSRLAGNAISGFLLDRQGDLWIGTFDGGLHRLSSKSLDSPAEAWSFERFRNDPELPESLASDTVTALFEDRRGDLWIGTNQGLDHWPADRRAADRQSDQEAGQEGFEHFRAPDQLAADVIPGIQWPIAEAEDGSLMIVTNGGVSILSADRSRSRHVLPDQPPGGPPIAAHLDRHGDLWIGTGGGGLYLLPRSKDRLQNMTHDPLDAASLSSNGVVAVFEDAAGQVWFGTNNGGLSSYSRHKHRFRQIRNATATPNGLRDNKAFGVMVDDEQRLWVSTFEGGVHRLGADRQTVERHYGLHPGTPFDIGSNGARAVVQDSRGDIWIGTLNAGLARVDRDTGHVIKRFFNDPQDPTSLANNFVLGLLEEPAQEFRQGRLWVANGGGGLSLMDPEKGTFQNLQLPQPVGGPAGNFVRFIEPSKHGYFWVGGSGLHKLDSETLEFTASIGRADDQTKSQTSNGLASANVMAVHEDDDGVWVATYGGGLDRCDLELTTCTHFTSRDGLPTDSIYSVLPDAGGHLWISSNQGLSRFDPQSRTLVNYEADDGLGGNEFNGRAFTLAPDGEMLFGGMHGVTAFYPEQAESSAFQPPVVLTAFRLFEEEQRFDRSLQALDRIVLTHRDDFFSFEFAALDFTNPEKNRYAYQLVGFDKDWIDAGSRRYASYTNLDGGDYLFRVRGTNVDGVWSQPREIEVIVIPPPWKTWWAYLLYALAAAGGIGGYVRHRTRAQAEELRAAREEAEAQRLMTSRLQQIDRMKDTFLANTSHELRTPLNGIIGIAESLHDGATGELPDPTRQNLTMIAASGRRLSRLVDDILDFSKLKSHELELRRGAVGMREVVDLVVQLSEPLVGDRNLVLENRVPADLSLVAGDENRLQQVMHNLIGNSLKFTAEGSITVEGRELDEHIEISVRDTGIGIAEHKLHQIFDSFEQADASTAREFGGTGLGLTITRQLIELHGGQIQVESEPGTGSHFFFTLPKNGSELDGASKLGRSSGAAQTPADDPAAQPSRGLAALGDTRRVSLPTPSTAPSSGRLQGVKVLSVDDDPINLQVLHNILTLEGCDLTEASGGEDALALIEDGYRPDLVLLDVMMPRLTGFEVCERLRKRYSGNQLPIILLTAKNQMSDLVQGLASGANDYLTKPFSKIELLARIDTHLSLSKAHSVEADNRRKAEELEQARAIQLSLLPQAPPELPFLDIAVHMTTATEVGGDYYDFFPQPDGSLYVITGDATGHGISAGMMVAMVKSTLKALDVQSPHILLRQVGGVIRSVNPGHMNMALNAVHIEKHELALSSAAMPPAFLYRGETGQVDELLIPGLPLGTSLETEYTLRLESFGPGDALILISDGLPELQNDFGEPLGYAAVEAEITRGGHLPADQLLRALVGLGESWSDGHRDDDITLVVIRRLGQSRT